MSRLLAFALLVFSLSLSMLVACGGADGAYSSADDDDDDGGGETGGDDDDGGGEGEPTPNGTPAPPDPGQLTAGDFDDNLNFDWYGLFTSYFDEEFPEYPLYLGMDRVTIRVQTASGDAIPGARVAVIEGETERFSGPVGNDGLVSFFPERDGTGTAEGLSVSVAPPGGAVVTFDAPAGAEWTFTVDGQASLPDTLELAFVLDATGSMGDEMSYLKDEVDSIAAYVADAFPDVTTRYGLVVYRDDGDEYVTRSFDFTDLQSFQAELGAQSANGGGDWPEALDRALGAAHELSWSQGNVTRIAFLIADAPAHEQYVDAYYQEVDVARALGIRWFPVAASGAMGDAEYLFRVLGHATRGRFLFLTDDSGIGLGHFDPHLPCFQVQYLNQLIARTIAGELSGTRLEPEPEDVLRTVGNYDEGRCLQDQQPAAFARVGGEIRKHADVPQ